MVRKLIVFILAVAVPAFAGEAGPVSQLREDFLKFHSFQWGLFK